LRHQTQLKFREFPEGNRNEPEAGVCAKTWPVASRKPARKTHRVMVGMTPEKITDSFKDGGA